MNKLVCACIAVSCIGPVAAQKIPDVQCRVEDYPVKAVVAWQFPDTLKSVQVAVLRDPAGEQEARFDLLHGASLVSLRLRGQEMLFGQTAGASISLFATRHGSEEELKGMTPYWSAYSPDQGGSSMGIPATTTGIACDGERSFRAIAMMQDRGVDNSFQKEPLLGLNMGRISTNFPPGYSTPYSIETKASWIPNPGGLPKFYLKLEQNAVNTRAGASGALEWFLTAAAPWNFGYASSYPANCTEKTPCRSDAGSAVAAGRYDDEARSHGIGMVVPIDNWQTNRVFFKQNAEYVVLLYNAVWAMPRRTFATVLQRPLDGVGGFPFTWYICAGAWKQVASFAKGQPKSHKPILTAAPEPAATVAEKTPNRIGCETTEFRPQPNQTDQAIVLKDPAGEQTVLFDTTQGGAIVSLRYRAIEHIWGFNGGGLLQMAFHNHMTKGAWAGDYNPTQAGDGSAMSPVTGIACDGTNEVRIQTMMLDFNHNNAFYEKPLIAVWGGKVNDMAPLSYSSPYVLETRAHWVANPIGEPRFYLKLEEHLVHVADEKVGVFDFDFAEYAPWEFGVRAVSPDSCPCSQSETGYMAGGWYQDEKRSAGLAIAMPSNNFPHNKVSGGFNSDYMWRNRNFHLTSAEALDGIAAKDFVWYVLAGTWENALAFSRSLR